MFSNDGEKKLDWMYKGPNALVDREEYLLGRGVDKTLEQLNEEEKRKSSTLLLPTPKNHVEHECIPPSIRDYNKIVQDEQVDLQAKLQEDPLVLIKRQEEETRRQFLQNPIQLKKLQDAMQAQLKKKKKRKKDEKIDKKLRKKLKLLDKQLKLKNGYKELAIKSEELEDEAILDTILMHKFHSLKNKLPEEDLRKILLGNFSESEDTDSDGKDKDKYLKSLNLNKTKSISYKLSNEQKDKDKFTSKYRENKKVSLDEKKKQTTKRLTEEEKEALRKSMMQQGKERSKEGVKKYEKFKKEKDKSEKLTHHGEEFIRREFLKSANASSVADRIKANVNNIQRSKSAMESNFLK